MRRRRCGVCERLDPGREIEALYVTPHLARSLHYTASLIDRAAESECAAVVGLALCAARHVFIDGAHMDPSLVEVVGSIIGDAVREGVRVARRRRA